MAQFTNTFTGKDTAVRLPSGEGVLRSQEDMNNLFLKAEQLKYETFKKNEDDFLKASAIDPAVSISNKATEFQSGLIDEFNKKWASKMQSSGGNLSTDQKIEMMKDRRMIEAEGSNIQAMQKAWEMHREMVARNPIDFDENEFNENTMDFMLNGKYNYPTPPLRAKDFASYIRAESQKNRNDAGYEWKKEGDHEVWSKRNVPAGKEGDEIERMFHNAPEGYKKGVFRDYEQWKQDNPDQFLKMFDSNQDGVVDGKDENKNPIMEWIRTNPKYMDQVVTWERSDKTRRPSSGGANNGTMRTWLNQKYIPPAAQKSPYEGLPSDKYHPFVNLQKPISIPVDYIQVLDAGVPNPKKEDVGQTIKGYIIGYDEQSDKVVFMVSQDYKDVDYSALSSGAKRQIAVPRSALPKTDFDLLEIEQDGKKTKLGEMAQKQEPYQPNVPLQGNSGIKWQTPPKVVKK